MENDPTKTRNQVPSVLTAASALTSMGVGSSTAESEDGDPGEAQLQPAGTDSSTTSSAADTSVDQKREVDDDVPMTFPQRLMEILSKEEHSSIISWLPHGKGFIIYQKKKFAAEIMPRYFKQSKFTSFTRKLNRWGFTRITRGPETGAYYHKFFQKGNSRLSMQMSCQSVKPPQHRSPHMTSLDLSLGIPNIGLPGLAAESLVQHNGTFPPSITPQSSAAAALHAQNADLLRQLHVQQQAQHQQHQQFEMTEIIHRAMLGLPAQPQQPQPVPNPTAFGCGGAAPPQIPYSPAAVTAAINSLQQQANANEIYLKMLKDKASSVSGMGGLTPQQQPQQQPPHVSATAAATAQQAAVAPVKSAVQERLEQVARESVVAAAAIRRRQQVGDASAQQLPQQRNADNAGMYPRGARRASAA